MVLSLKAWKSRSLPGLPRTLLLLDTTIDFQVAASNGGHFLLQRRWSLEPQAQRQALTGLSAFSVRSGLARRPQRRNAPAKCLRFFGEQAAGKSLGCFQM